MSESENSQSARVARQVLAKTLRVRRGENVIIESWSEALPWAVPFVNEARKLGAHPMMLYEDEDAFWAALRSGSSRATGKVGDHEWKALDSANAYVFFFGPAHWPRYDDLPDKQTAGVAAYNPEWYRRAAKAKVRGARMQIGRTSSSAAERFHVDLEKWRSELERASLVSVDRLHSLAEKVGRRLKNGKEVRVTHDNGTDLRFRLGRYPIQSDDGLVDDADLKAGNNMATIPGGVVGVAIDHTSAEGAVVGNHTVYPSSGPADGVHWVFRDGRLVEHSYGTGGEQFEKEFNEAPKTGRDRLSYVSIGLNPELFGSPQMEDQEIGSVMLRIGGNTFGGGKNASPFGTWVVVKGADVSVDGQPLVKGGTIS